MDNFNRNLIVVDETDKIIGTIKALTGHYKTHLTLHRAFSLFLVNDKNELIMQKRASSKLVFPNLWANTVCSHPFLNPLSFIDPIKDAKNHLLERLKYELGVTELNENDLEFFGRVLYKATDKECYGYVMESDPYAQEYKEFETGENIVVEKNSKNFFEWEVDYIFVCKKNVKISCNPEEVSEIAFVKRAEYDDMVEEGKVSKWTQIIIEKSDIFSYLEKL